MNIRITKKDRFGGAKYLQIKINKWRIKISTWDALEEIQ